MGEVIVEFSLLFFFSPDFSSFLALTLLTGSVPYKRFWFSKDWFTASVQVGVIDRIFSLSFF